MAQHSVDVAVGCALEFDDSCLATRQLRGCARSVGESSQRSRFRQVLAAGVMTTKIFVAAVTQPDRDQAPLPEARAQVGALVHRADGECARPARRCGRSPPRSAVPSTGLNSIDARPRRRQRMCVVGGNPQPGAARRARWRGLQTVDTVMASTAQQVGSCSARHAALRAVPASETAARQQCGQQHPQAFERQRASSAITLSWHPCQVISRHGHPQSSGRLSCTVVASCHPRSASTRGEGIFEPMSDVAPRMPGARSFIHPTARSVATASRPGRGSRRRRPHAPWRRNASPP